MAQKLDIQQVLSTPQSDVHLYVCGPTGFMDWILTAARQLDCPDPQVHREYFAAPSSVVELPTDAFEVQVASSGKSFIVPANKTIVDVLHEHGLDIPTSCE